MAVPNDSVLLEVASVALDEVEAAAGAAQPGSRTGVAKYHAKAAYEYLGELQGGYDPAVDAPASAKKAAVVWVKVALAGGDPVASNAFRAAERAWKTAAAAAVWKVKRADELAEELEGDEL